LRIRQIITGEKGLSRTDVVAAICLACNLTKEQVFCHMDREIDEARLHIVRRHLDERIAGKPLSYITGVREFFSETFAVNEDVLIPRPETEVLVEEALAIIGDRKGLAILDMGTGSGAIGIIVAKHTGNRVVCVDISVAALAVARRNAASIGVEQATRFVCADLFSATSAGAKFDIVLANLPYVASDEWQDLMVDVRAYEPHGALDGGEGGVEVYRRLIGSLPGHLAPGGHVLLEIGSSRQACDVGSMLERAGLRVQVKRDYSGRERVLEGHG